MGLSLSLQIWERSSFHRFRSLQRSRTHAIMNGHSNIVASGFDQNPDFDVRVPYKMALILGHITMVEHQIEWRSRSTTFSMIRRQGGVLTQKMAGSTNHRADSEI